MSNPQLISRQLQDTALRYFIEVVRCGSISEASNRLNVAGSAISRHITHLEALLGTSLFDRHARGMVPNAAGERLAVHAIKSAHDAERLVHDLRAMQGVAHGRVRIAATDGFSMEFLPRLISDFNKLHPGIQFHLGVFPPSECTKRVLNGDVDLGVVMSRGVDKDIHVEHIQPSPVMAVMTTSHPLAKAKQLSLVQLKPYPLALPESDTTVRQLFDIACHWRRLQLEPMLTCSHIGSLISFLRNSKDAITISGEITTRYQVERGELVSIRLRDKGLDLRNIEVQTLLGRSMSRSTQAFLDYLKSQLSKP